MNIARVALAAAALAATAGSANAATSIVQNGSFEFGVNPTSSTNSQLDSGTDSADDITGWRVEQGSVDYIRFLWEASDGERSVDLAGSQPGVLSQVLNNLVSGKLYSVKFDISKNPDGGMVPRLGTSSVTDVSTGTLLGGLALSFSEPNTRLDMMWATVSYSFVAMSQQALLSFAADGPSSTDANWPLITTPAFGLAVDNVSVVAVEMVAPVPEPATWALMILGFGIVGSALRRRRTQVRFNFA